MINTVTGLIAVVGLLVFLGYYAVTLNSVPLWVIIVAILGAACYDYVRSVRAKRDVDGEQSGPGAGT